jgi:hypothetical protein
MDGGPDNTNHWVTELSSAADNVPSNSPGIHRIDIDHEATDKGSCEIMCDVIIPVLLQG